MARSRAGLGILVEIIGDEKSLLRANASAVASNTKLNASLRSVGVLSEESASAQVAAKAKVIEADRAQVAELQKVAAKVVGNAKLSEAANLAVAESQAKLNRELGLSSVALGSTSTAAKKGEADLNKLVRGGLAGSGAFSALGRSLAFASSGFIAFAAGATLIAKSISAARALAVAQRQVNRQLETSGKTLKQYGAQIDSATGKLTHIAGFTKVDLLGAFGFAARATGNVSNSLKLLSIAADVARGRGLNLQSSMIALTKAVGGSSTALRRLGIIVPKTAKGWDAINFVAAKFAGQAQAGTTVTQRFSATLVTTEEIIGKALLPSVNKLLTSLGDWLQKMNETGRLHKDVNKIIHDAGQLFRTFGTAIHYVDEVTGSFKNTLEALIALKFASIMAGWISNITLLAGKWGLVTTAATEAATAEKLALGGGIAAGAGGAAGASSLASRIEPYTIGGAAAIAARAARAGELAGVAKFARIGAGIGGIVAGGFVGLGGGLRGLGQSRVSDVSAPDGGKWRVVYGPDGKSVIGKLFLGYPAVVLPSLRTFGGSGIPSAFNLFPGRGAGAGAGGPFSGLTPHPQVSGFQLRLTEQIAQAQAALTKSTTDDVKVARQIIARIKKIIDEGNYTQKGLLAILQAEGAALGVVQQAAAAAAAKRVAAIQAAKAKALAAFANLVDPLSVEVELLRAEAAGRSTLPALRKLLASARRALEQAKGLAQQQQALQQIVSIQGQIKSLSTQASVTFVASLKLQLALAKDQALGRNDTKDLLKLRSAILKFIKAHRKNTAALIDAYGQLAAVNQQLASSAASALGLFKQASTRALARGLGLSPDQERRLRARLSQLGPGGTVPTAGASAAGYAINPDTGRPIVIHTHLNIDGKRVADNTTRHQQKHRRRNPGQRRGPHAGD